MKDSNCALCGAKLMSRGKFVKDFSTKNFGAEGKKQVLKPICTECEGRIK